MTRKQISIDTEAMKGLLTQQEDFLKPLVQAVVQEVLEVEFEFRGANGCGRSHLCRSLAGEVLSIGRGSEGAEQCRKKKSSLHDEKGGCQGGVGEAVTESAQAVERLDDFPANRGRGEVPEVAAVRKDRQAVFSEGGF